MYDQKYIADKLKTIGKLLEIKGESTFKTRAYNNGARIVEGMPDLPEKIRTGTLGRVKGIGAALNDKIKDLYNTGTTPLFDRLTNEMPKGILDMMRIKGLGPKKIQIIWGKMGITTLGELLYACNENRLAEEKGFGLKTQESIRQSIEYVLDNADYFYFAKLQPLAMDLLAELGAEVGGDRLALTGEVRRKMPILPGIEVLAYQEDEEKIKAWFRSAEDYFLKETQEGDTLSAGIAETSIPIEVYFAKDGEWARRLFETTGNPDHVHATGADLSGNYASEKEIYQSAGLAYVEPEMRENRGEIALAKQDKLPELVVFEDLKGILHNHSTWSDGIHTLEEMANACRDLGMEYFGICDHSKTAFYANGLSEGRVEQQHKEIDRLNAQFDDFRILKGIESDILPSGELDYAPSLLEKFDFIVASVHSQLNMDEEKATARLIKAIENPYTSILGHATGRLLLVRKGYPIDHKKVIEACAANGVAIELNAHPARLDMDWTWLPYALSKGVKISINPDAHKKDGLLDMHWGVAAARKGHLSADMTLNALGLEDLLTFFAKRRSLAGV